MDRSGSRTIIARFLRFPDRERVFKCGRKLKGTNYKMFEDIPKELHELRKQQMDKLRQARKGEKCACFSTTEPNIKVYIDSIYMLSCNNWYALCLLFIYLFIFFSLPMYLH